MWSKTKHTKLIRVWLCFGRWIRFLNHAHLMRICSKKKKQGALLSDCWDLFLLHSGMQSGFSILNRPIVETFFNRLEVVVNTQGQLVDKFTNSLITLSNCGAPKSSSLDFPYLTQWLDFTVETSVALLFLFQILLHIFSFILVDFHQLFLFKKYVLI